MQTKNRGSAKSMQTKNRGSAKSMLTKNGGSAKSTVAVALLIGAVAGGIATLLLAPQSGAQIRGRLRRAPRDLRERVGHRATDGQARAVNVKRAKS